MEILLTGYTAFLTQEWIETAFPDDHVLTTHTKSEALLDTRVKTVTLDGKQLLAQINETYQFDRIVYFSEYLYIFLYLQRLLHTFYFRQVLLRQSSHRESAVESRAFHYWQFRFSSVRESL